LVKVGVARGRGREALRRTSSATLGIGFIGKGAFEPIRNGPRGSRAVTLRLLLSWVRPCL